MEFCCVIFAPAIRKRGVEQRGEVDEGQGLGLNVLGLQIVLQNDV